MAFWPTCRAMRAYSALRSSSSTSSVSAVATARRARSTLTARSDCSRIASMNCAGSWPVACSHWSSEMPCAWKLLHGVLHPCRQVAGDHRLRGSISTRPTSASVVRSMNRLRAWLSRCVAEPLGERRPPRLDRVELADVLVDPLVGRRSGRTTSCTFCDVDGEVGLVAGAVRRGGEVQLVADGGAEQLAVEPGGHPALADLVQPVLGVEAGRPARRRASAARSSVTWSPDCTGRSTSASEPWRRELGVDRPARRRPATGRARAARRAGRRSRGP